MRRFFPAILGLIFLSNFFVASCFHLVLRLLRAPEWMHWGLGAFILLQVAGFSVMVGARLLGQQPGTGMGRPLLSFLMIWNLLLALPTAVVGLIWAAVDGFVGPSAPEAVGRMIGLIAVALPFALNFVATVVAVGQLGNFRIRRLTLNIPNLPEAMRGLTIAHLSDLHLGKLTRGRVLDKIIAATNALQPDVILFTGDLINISLEDLPAALEFLRALQSRHGLFLCEGNHDLIESRRGFEAAIKASGLRFLLNESATFSVNGQTVQVLGLRWGEETTGTSPDPAPPHRLLTQRDPGDFTILLAHHPDAFDAAAEAGIALTLAGHTHGGQLMLTPRFGFGPWLYRYWSGLYRKGESHLVVSNGVGNWFPLRLGAPAEIIQLRLE